MTVPNRVRAHHGSPAAGPKPRARDLDWSAAQGFGAIVVFLALAALGILVAVVGYPKSGLFVGFLAVIVFGVIFDDTLTEPGGERQDRPGRD